MNGFSQRSSPSGSGIRLSLGLRTCWRAWRKRLGLNTVVARLTNSIRTGFEVEANSIFSQGLRRLAGVSSRAGTGGVSPISRQSRSSKPQVQEGPSDRAGVLGSSWNGSQSCWNLGRRFHDLVLDRFALRVRRTTGATVAYLPPNNALQRTRAALSLQSVPGEPSTSRHRRAPLSFEPLGGRR